MLVSDGYGVLSVIERERERERGNARCYCDRERGVRGGVWNVIETEGV